MFTATLLSSVLVISAYGYPYLSGSQLNALLSSQAVLQVKNADRFPQAHNPICVQIEQATSSGTRVFYPGDHAYNEDILHWATSGIEQSKCSVRPDTAENIAIILRILGKTRTPFAVKGGGHATNPGFSSTTGVHISMTRFSEVVYNASSQTATVGASLIWDDVYAALAPHGVNVVGGRESGVGVAGFTLGGGASYLTNQRGLTVDNVVAYELVQPTGDIVTVTKASYPDIFFGLKDVFSRDFLSLIQSFPTGDDFGRAIYNGTPILGYTAKILCAIANETVVCQTMHYFSLCLFDTVEVLVESLKEFGVTYVDYGVQPFLPTAFEQDVQDSSAYPPTRKGVCPFHLYFAWSDEHFDKIFHEAARRSAAHLAEIAAAEGQDVARAAIYPNYTIFDTPLEVMYGGNLHALRTLKKFVDPENVMGLAGGFKF